ncbi:unnamed protein product [Clonostachys chloroleuca]|uniref:Mannan endo-1,6-alpha-mannosidase n=1 Tax=Clonostachys chloroleuca TaxID=1926264 RepID=A0AA35VHA3_9HYPO|nr:unnamed protein product [Clonostachys chloroleuca]
MLLRRALLAFGLLTSTATALEAKVGDEASVKKAADTVAYGLLKFYTGNNTGDVPGNLPDPYYWWVCGAMFGTMVDYWHYTGDSQYNDITKQAMVHQAGPDRDFMPKNQTLTLGNDDQGFWALAAMSAAEYVFPDPPADQPQWVAIVQAVFNEYTTRWDTQYCGGGLRWQIYNFNVGWDYKNSISNGCFFNLASRLARYTGNTTYAEWANKIWDWEEKIGLITKDYAVLDGVTIKDGAKCEDDMDKTEWSYNSGIFLHGSAVMYDLTKDQKWRTRVDGLVEHGLQKFGKDNIAFEQLCEPHGTCDDNQRTFKGYWLRWLSATIQLIPDLHDKIWPLLKGTAEAAASICIGTPTHTIAKHPPFKGMAGTACGFKWNPPKVFDDSFGVGEQMSALSALIYTLVKDSDAPKTNSTGGTSIGNPNSGSRSDDEKIRVFAPITTGDRVGAGILTTLIIGGVLGGCAFVVI